MTLDFDTVDYPEPHLNRTRQMLKTHPELKSLFGRAPSSAVLVVGLVAFQIAGAWLLRGAPWWAVLIAAYTLGAVANHALWVLIHECTHNLVLRSSRANSLLQILANGPIIFPASISFRKLHLLHHRFQGNPEIDADLSSPLEARLVGNSAVGKSLWLLTFFLWQALRVPNLKAGKLWDGWYALNACFQVLFIGGIAWLAGLHGVAYLTLASIFAIGLHPMGARWIQEHYTIWPDQETFSYYGPLNWVALNVGYHNEHHDLMTVPWFRLPKIRAGAPEFYQSLRSHRSWTALLLQFIFDPKFSLYSRKIRVPKGQRPAETELAQVVSNVPPLDELRVDPA